MSTVKKPEPVGYFACNPETLKPEWGEDCVCQDNIYEPDENGTVGRPFVFADQAEAYAAERVQKALELLWRPMLTAPMNGTEVLASMGNGEVMLIKWVKNAGYDCYTGWSYFNNEIGGAIYPLVHKLDETPLGWMPKPNPKQ